MYACMYICLYSWDQTNSAKLKQAMVKGIINPEEQQS